MTLIGRWITSPVLRFLPGAASALLAALLLPAASAQTTLTNGGVQNGTITAGGAGAWLLQASEGDTVYLRASRLTGGSTFTPRINVYDAAGVLVGNATGAASSSASSARLELAGKSSGQYRLVVDSANASAAGTYRIDFLRLPQAWTVPSGDTGGPLANGANHDGAISTGDLDTWTLNAAGSGRIELRLAKTTGDSGFTPRLRVVDSLGRTVGDAEGTVSSGTPEARISFQPGGAGSYHVIVDSLTAEGAGGYRLSYLDAGSPYTIPSGDDGAALASGGSHDGGTTLGDLDPWTFEAAAGELVQLNIARLTGVSGYAPRVRVYDPSGTLAAYVSAPSSPTLSDGRIQFSPTATGIHKVVVDSEAAGRTGTYRLFHLRLPGSHIIPSGDDGNALAAGNNDGSTTVGDLDPWSFSASSGNRVTITVSHLSGGSSYAPRIRVYSPAGTLSGQARASSSTPSAWTFIAPTSGTYQVIVDSDLAHGAGGYRLNYLLETGSYSYPSVDGTTLTNGGNHEGTIELNETDGWRFTANAGEFFQLRAGRLAGSFNLFLQIHDPNGQLVTATSSPEYDTPLSGRASVTGTYRVTLSSWYSGGAGTYRIHFLKTSGTPAVPGGDEGGTLSNGGNHDGSITNGDLDPWTFTANAGELFQLRAGRTSGSFSIFLQIHDPNGQLVAATSAVESDTPLTLRATMAGTYRATLSSWYTAGTGSYRIHFLKIPGDSAVPAGDDGGTLSSGGNHDGTITNGDLDPWTFTASAGELFQLRAGRLSGSFSLFLQIHDPEGQPVTATSSVESDTFLSGRATVAGTYRVTLSSWYLNGTGTYRIHFLKAPGTFTVPGADEGGELTNGGNHDGSIANGDLDPWSFHANAGELFQLRAGRLSSSISLFMQIHDPNGQPVTSTTSVESDTFLSGYAPVTGTYRVTISSWYSGGSGTYRIHYLKIPGDFVIPGGDEGGALANGGNHDGSIENADLDPWTFAAKAGELFQLRAGRRSGSLSLLLQIHDPNGQLVATTSSVESDTFLTGRALITGTYHVTLSSWYRADTGAYRLHYLKIPGGFTIPDGDEGGAMGAGTVHDGTLGVADLDVWSFIADAGNSITVQLQELVSGSSLSVQLQIYRPDGQLLGSHTHSSLAQLQFSAPDTGLYTVVVSSSNAGGSGGYRLSATGLPSQAPAMKFVSRGAAGPVLTWPSSLFAEGWLLEQSETLAPGSWAPWNNGSTLEDNGSNVRFTMPVEGGKRFVRLRRP